MSSNKQWVSLFDNIKNTSSSENKKSDYMIIKEIFDSSHGFNFIEKIPQSIIKKSKIINKK